jgi:hypothetical protein
MSWHVDCFQYISAFPSPFATQSTPQASVQIFSSVSGYTSIRAARLRYSWVRSIAGTVQFLATSWMQSVLNEHDDQ